MIGKLQYTGVVAVAAAVVSFAVATLDAQEFRPRVTLELPSGSEGIDAGDFDGDGRLDLAIGCSSQEINVFFGEDDGSLGSPVAFGIRDAPFFIEAADLDNDGRSDLIFNNAQMYSAEIGTAYGKADRTFTEVESHVVGGYGTYIRMIGADDLDGDGRVDIAAAMTSGYLPVLRGDPSGGFAPFEVHDDKSYSYGICIADFNVDGRKDVATSSDARDSISVLFGQADGSLSLTSHYTARPWGLTSADFNRDGRPDLAYASMSNEVGVMLSEEPSGFSEPWTRYVSGRAMDIASGDFNGDGFSDLAAVALNDNKVTILMGNGDGTFDEPVMLYASFKGGSQVIAADLDGNGYDDIAVSTGSNYTDIFYAVPEPSTLALLATGTLGLLGFGWRRRRDRHKSTWYPL